MPHFPLRVYIFSLMLGMTLPGGLLLAQTPSAELQKLIADLQAQVQILTAQVNELKAQLAATKQEIDATKQETAATTEELQLTRPLKRGLHGDDVTQLQEYLKQFPDIYPEGLITGFFGPATEAAVKKLQEKYGIESIGIVGPKTLSKINELITEGAGESGVMPPGLVKVSGGEKELGTSTHRDSPSLAPVVPGATAPSLRATTTVLIVATTTSGIPLATTTATSSSTPVSSSSSTPTGSAATTTAITNTVTTTTTATTPNSVVVPPPSSPPASISHACGQPINVPQDTSSIQTALNSACSGDTIYIAAGIYRENLKISKSRLTLKGANGTSPDQVIIDGGLVDNVILIGGVPGTIVSDTVIDGVTVQNGRCPQLPCILYSGISIVPAPYLDWHITSNAGNTVVRNIIAKENGVGVYVNQTVWNGTVTIDRSLIIDNVHTGISEGSSFYSSPQQLFITNNTIVGNRFDGVDDLNGASSRTFRNNIIAKNGHFGIESHFPEYGNKSILYNDTWGNAKGNYYNYNTDYNPVRYTAFSPSPGTGELSLDPQFVSATDYHLQSISPVINAGDPSTAVDPDGSRADMGAYPSTQTSSVSAPTPAPTQTSASTSTPSSSPTSSPVATSTTTQTTASYPDLIITSFTVDPLQLPAGNPVHFQVTIKNQGNAPALASTVSFTNTSAETTGAFGLIVGALDVAALPSGASVSLTYTSLPLPVVGRYIFYAAADSGGTNVEGTGEGNNVVTSPIVVDAILGKPDLTINGMNASAPAYAGASISLSAQVVNGSFGAGPAPASKVLLSLPGVSQTTLDVPPLALKQSAWIGWQTTLPLTPGKIIFRATADPDNQIDETREDDNIGATEINVLPSGTTTASSISTFDLALILQSLYDILTSLSRQLK